MNPIRSTIAGLLTGAVIIIGTIATAGCTAPNLPPPVPPNPPTPTATVTPTLVPASPSTLAVDTEPSTETSTAAPTEPTPATSATSTANPPPLTAADVSVLTGKVVSVYDGDTFTVSIEGERTSIRPLGIDAPELQNDNLKITGECYGPQSRDAAKNLLTGTTVRLTVDPEQGDPNDDYRDRNGRLLRYVEVPLDTADIATAQSTVDFGDYQLRGGNAWVYEQYPVERTPDYMTEMHQAQAERDGLWASCE